MRATTLLLPGWLAACSAADVDSPSHDPRLRALAADVYLWKISVLQAHEIPLYLSERATSAGAFTPEVVIGRDAVLRVEVDADPYTYEERELTGVLAVLTPDGHEHLLEETVRLPATGSLPHDLRTSFQFELPGELVSPDFTYEVSLHEAPFSFRYETGAAGPVTWTSAEPAFAARATDVLRVEIVPVVYHYDGSGRTPPLDEARVEALRAGVAAAWPATDVIITVGNPLGWGKEITSNGAWGSLLNEIQNRRAAAAVPPNTYFYGMFTPTESWDTYCGSSASEGCTLGLGVIGEAGDPSTRAAVGVGYDVLDPRTPTLGTLLHEVGHNHGRVHAPCGTGGDAAYPYEGAIIGAWGYDAATRSVFAPDERVDMMSYCDPIWLSDYTYERLGDFMIDARSRAAAVGPVGRYAVFELDGDRAVPLSRDVARAPALDAPTLPIRLVDADGRSLGEVDATFSRLDHLDSVLVRVPEHPELATIERLDR